MLSCAVRQILNVNSVGRKGSNGRGFVCQADCKCRCMSIPDGERRSVEAARLSDTSVQVGLAETKAGRGGSLVAGI